MISLFYMLINLIVDSVPNVESLEIPNCIDPVQELAN
jgi:hypothetical protein